MGEGRPNKTPQEEYSYPFSKEKKDRNKRNTGGHFQIQGKRLPDENLLHSKKKKGELAWGRNQTCIAVERIKTECLFSLKKKGAAEGPHSFGGGGGRLEINVRIKRRTLFTLKGKSMQKEGKKRQTLRRSKRVGNRDCCKLSSIPDSETFLLHEG